MSKAGTDINARLAEMRGALAARKVAAARAFDEFSDNFSAAPMKPDLEAMIARIRVNSQHILYGEATDLAVSLPSLPQPPRPKNPSIN